MKAHVLFLAALAVAAGLAGCDRGKPRHLPPDPMELPAEAHDVIAAPNEGLSGGLKRLHDFPIFTLDHVGTAADPLMITPAVTAGGMPIRVDGFGFDPIAHKPGKGIDVVIDGKAYGTVYGRARRDVANHFKTDGLRDVGFATTLPPWTLKPGPHTVTLRVIAAEGGGYFETKPIPFAIN